MQISSNFDSGNIEVLSITGTTARLAIRKDAQSDFYQWFHFRVSGAAGRDLTLRQDSLTSVSVRLARAVGYCRYCAVPTKGGRAP